MTIRHMAWLTAAIWVIVFTICIMFHSFGFLDQKVAWNIIGVAASISVVAWFFWVTGR